MRIHSSKLALGVVALLVTLSVPSGDAHSQPAAGTDAAQRADALFEKGKALYKSGRKREAYEALLAAWSSKKSYDIAANLGSAELSLGMPRDAAEHFGYALRTFPATGNKKQLPAMQQLFTEARGQVGGLIIKVSVEGADVLIDGKSIGRSPIQDEVFVNPGERTVEAKLNGYELAKQSAKLTNGGSQVITLSLLPAVAPPVASVAVAPAVPASASAAPPPVVSGAALPIAHPVLVPPPRSVIPGVVLAGVGVAALAMGTGLFIAGNGKRSTAEDLQKSIVDGHRSCVTGVANFDVHCTDLADASSSADTLHKVGFGLLLGGGAVASGAIAFLLWPSSKPTTGASVRVLPVATTTGGGLFATGNF